mmetsp:Transcript_36002/g.85391  ORF Transcript_36002/g.85391 Transcript_36002/m.85391 type:complete len:89 (+) Transcript_36002:1079-1345(+)
MGCLFRRVCLDDDCELANVANKDNWRAPLRRRSTRNLPLSVAKTQLHLEEFWNSTVFKPMAAFICSNKPREVVQAMFTCKCYKPAVAV